MDDMATVRINGAMIAWARRRIGATVDSLSTRTITPSTVQAWEDGTVFPTETQAMALADQLGIAYSMLFIPNVPPDEKLKIPDLRTVSGRPLTNPSRDFLAVLDDATARKEWISEERRDTGEKPLGFVGKFSLNDSVNRVADDMRSSLGLDGDLRRKTQNFEGFIRLLIARAEDSGVLVMRSTIVRHITTRTLDSNEFRGFNLVDKFAPIVFINDEDVKAAQIFTLAHELAHIWIGQEGISDRRPEEKGSSNNPIEVFCDKVAAELLVPESEFAQVWDNRKPASINIAAISNYFKVSELVTLRRAKDLAKISSDYFVARVAEKVDAYKKREAEALAKQKAKPKEEQGGNFWASFDLRNSARFNRTVAASVVQQRLTYTEASTLLGVSALTVASYINRLRATQ